MPSLGRSLLRPGTGALLALTLLFLSHAAPAQVSDLKRDEAIIFFPTIGCRAADGKSWELEIHGCVYEPENRTVTLALLRKALEFNGVKMTDAENAIFTERARLFMVDHERGNHIVIQVGENRVVCGKSRPDGQFSGVARLTDAEVRLLRQGPTNGPGRIRFEAVLPPKDARLFAGEVELLDDTGLTVISDIDDTIKITQVTDRKAMLRNTFLKPFQPVPGMAGLYRGWEEAGAQFCYVSASPWQLLGPLVEFTRTNGFPAGAFYLKNFRWKDESFFSLFQGPEKYKPAVLEALLQRFPKRHFVLVGDAGERDPEIYAALARQYPEQVVRILIRDTTGELAKSERGKQVFGDLPPVLWQVFREPSEISALEYRQ